MADFNLVIIGGNITNAPQVRTTSTGSKVADFCVAVHRRLKDGEDTCFMPVTVWGKMAEVCATYLQKGSGVLVRGYFKQEQWQAQDGSTQRMTKVIAEEVQFTSRPRQQDGQQNNQQAQTQNRANDLHKYAPQDARQPSVQPPSDDIPF